MYFVRNILTTNMSASLFDNTAVVTYFVLLLTLNCYIDGSAENSLIELRFHVTNDFVDIFLLIDFSKTKKSDGRRQSGTLHNSPTHLCLVM